MLYLIGFFIVFIVFILIIVFIIFKKSPSEPVIKTLEPAHDGKVTLESLISILQHETKERSKIENALVKMEKSFPFPEDEKEANDYFKFVYYYARSPLSSAKMIVNMQKMLTMRNPKYAKQIEAFQMRGVDARNK
ncbi:MAG: hypothetical protein IBX43_03165 [Campylobacterales bacterium]|nr:hypothetical protein [Campylobacterales bacterium]